MKLDRINDLRAHTAPLADALIEAVQRVLASGWFALGPEVDAFENEFAAYCGAEHCVGVANGTDALELLLRAMRTGSGDEVITAANAGMYSTTALLATGATPVYADVDSCSLTLSPESVADRVTPRTRVVIATHLFGRMANLEALRSLADRHALALIEDCAQAHGASLKGRRAGTWAHGSAFSFYPTKNLGALGDAGAVVTSDGALAERVRRLRQYGWSTKYESSDRGGKNSRLDEMQAAVLRVKLPFLDQWNAQRKAVAACYNTTLQHPDVHTPSVVGDDYVAHLYVVQCSHRAALREYLNKRTIATGVHYPLLDYQQPFLRPDYGHMNLPISEQALPRILSLPCYPELSLDAVRRTCESINHWKI